MITVLAIDQGTSGTKALVINNDNEILGIGESSITPFYAAGGIVEQEPWQLLNSVVESAKEAIRQANIPIDIVTLANQGETVLAWDPVNGNPLTNMLVWQDRRSDTICERLASYSEFICNKTGLILNSYFSAPKMVWIRENLTKKGVVTTSDSWLIWQLTGQLVTDISTASRSLIMNIETGKWDDELLNIFGLQNEKLPRIVANDELIGTTRFFGELMHVGGLIVDQQAALLAQNCLEPGEVKCTFGTGAFILANIGHHAILSGARLAMSVAWQQRGKRNYCFDGQVYTAASVVRWITELGLINSAADLDLVAAKDAQGVISIPALAGLAAPWWQSTVKASLSGMTLSTTREHIVLALLQGIAAQIAEIAEHIEDDLKYKINLIRVDGGLTRSKVLMQCVSDIMQVQVDVYPSVHATPLGATALARMAINSQLSLQEAIVTWTPEYSYKPVWSSQEAKVFRQIWRSEVEKMLNK